jgi:hypothetical protein
MSDTEENSDVVDEEVKPRDVRRTLVVTKTNLPVWWRWGWCEEATVFEVKGLVGHEESSRECGV